jgi:glycosyltransferase involved in cell wall biosynthesis
MNESAAGVTFVVTVYNKEKYLEATLRCVLAQEGDFAKEIIVVDDGSTDRSLQIANDMVGALPNARVIHQQNTGPSVAHNVGVKTARMRAVKFVDGDDLLPPDAAARMLPGLNIAGVGLVHGGGDELAAPGSDVRVDRHGKPPQFRVMEKPLYYAIRHTLAGNSSLLVSRDAFLAVGGCDPMVFLHENSVVFRMAMRNAFAFLDEVLLFSPPRDFRTAHGGHLGDIGVQMEHDRNAALFGLIRDFPELPRAIKRLALRRAAGRAWNWARRHNHKPWGGDETFWIKALSYAPWLPAYDKLLYRTMMPYRVGGKVRVPPETGHAQDLR